MFCYEWPCERFELYCWNIETQPALLPNYSNFVTFPLPLVINADQPKQEKRSAFLVNIQNLTTLKLGEGKSTFYIVRNRIKWRYKLINDEIHCFRFLCNLIVHGHDWKFYCCTFASSKRIALQKGLGTTCLFWLHLFVWALRVYFIKDRVLPIRIV